MDMLDDLGFADDLALLSRSINQMRKKIGKLEHNSNRVGLSINATEEMRFKTAGKAKPVCCRRTQLETLEEFISSDGGANKDVNALLEERCQQELIQSQHLVARGEEDRM
ncbi:hypothetical protein JOB18_042208 [Solea senegalensis]|uniref:Reverse transcriptase domain-containing protein n=1 Tax=Solea senegalensis TaxID=28829 RepID=A0AAV6RSZ4_SOLSE|nr:hypothetical protein JOB18_042208 [Solea senegalensis]